MIHRAEEIAKRAVEETENPGLTIFALNEFEHQPQSLGMLACATIAPGGFVEYHVHKGECEYYYILSGSGEYDDNGTVVKVHAGDITFTGNGEGHGLKNNGEQPLVFLPIIVRY